MRHENKLNLSIFIFFAIALTSCGDTKTIQSLEKMSGKKSSPLVEAQESKKPSEGFPSVTGQEYTADSIRILCDDGSSFTSLLTNSMEASDQAYASRIIPEMALDGGESDLILNVRQPVILNHSKNKLTYIFEGALSNTANTTGELFRKKIFTGTFDYSKRENAVVQQSSLDEISSQIETEAEALGLTLKSYGKSQTSEAILLPENLQSAPREYVLRDASAEWRIPCPVAECFNPSSREDKNMRSVLFDRYNSSRHEFEVDLFEQQEPSGTFYFQPLPLEGSAYFSKFFNEKTIAWLEKRGDQRFWVAYDLQTQSRFELNLQNLSDTESKVIWSASFDEKIVGFVSWNEKGNLKIGFGGIGSSGIERVAHIKIENLLDKDEMFSIYSFQLIDRNVGLISFATALGPRLFRIDFAEEAPTLKTLTRSNCANFSVVFGGKK